jgi:hypothetical protein
MPTPFIFRREFPFCPKELTFYNTVPAGYDYIDLPETGGDKGLKEAMKWYWKFQTLVVQGGYVATNTVDPVYPWYVGSINVGYVAFPFIVPDVGLSVPFPAQSTDFGYAFNATMASESITFSSDDMNSFVAPQPVRRMCLPLTPPDIVGSIMTVQLEWDYNGGAPDFRNQETFNIQLSLGYDEATSRWRLLYKYVHSFGFFEVDGGGLVTNPASAPSSPPYTLTDTVTTPDGVIFNVYGDTSKPPYANEFGLIPEFVFPD